MDTTANEDEQSKKEVWEKYFLLEERIRESIDVARENGTTFEEIKDMVKEANDCLQLVPPNKDGLRTLLFDASVYNKITLFIKSYIEKKYTSYKVFRAQEFAHNVVNLMVPHTRVEGPPKLTKEHWTKFGYATMHLYKYAFGVEPLLGALETLEPPRPPRVVRRRVKDAERKKIVPDQLKQGESGSELKTEEVTRIYNLLKQCYKERRKEPINFFHFVVNPQSFGLTVENMFHLSFLVSHKLVEIKEDQDGIPVIIPLRASAGPISSLASTDIAEKKSYQCVLQMDMQEWKELVDLFNIKEAMIPAPTRTPNKRTV